MLVLLRYCYDVQTRSGDLKITICTSTWKQYTRLMTNDPLTHCHLDTSAVII